MPATNRQDLAKWLIPGAPGNTAVFQLLAGMNNDRRRVLAMCGRGNADAKEAQGEYWRYFLEFEQGYGEAAKTQDEYDDAKPIGDGSVSTLHGGNELGSVGDLLVSPGMPGGPIKSLGGLNIFEELLSYQTEAGWLWRNPMGNGGSLRRTHRLWKNDGMIGFWGSFALDNTTRMDPYIDVEQRDFYLKEEGWPKPLTYFKLFWPTINADDTIPDYEGNLPADVGPRDWHLGGPGTTRWFQQVHKMITALEWAALCPYRVQTYDITAVPFIPGDKEEFPDGYEGLITEDLTFDHARDQMMLNVDDSPEQGPYYIFDTGFEFAQKEPTIYQDPQSGQWQIGLGFSWFARYEGFLEQTIASVSLDSNHLVFPTLSARALRMMAARNVPDVRLLLDEDFIVDRVATTEPELGEKNTEGVNEADFPEKEWAWRPSIYLQPSETLEVGDFVPGGHRDWEGLPSFAVGPETSETQYQLLAVENPEGGQPLTMPEGKGLRWMCNLMETEQFVQTHELPESGPLLGGGGSFVVFAWRWGYGPRALAVDPENRGNPIPCYVRIRPTSEIT